MAMKKIYFFAVLLWLGASFLSCKKETPKSERFTLLTNKIWVAESLLGNGNDESGPGGLLEDFKGDTKFNTDGTGYVGSLVGNWQFATNETQIVIQSTSLPAAVTMNIIELTTGKLKLTTGFPRQSPPYDIIAISMEFKPK
jgi:hypothetical protein